MYVYYKQVTLPKKFYPYLIYKLKAKVEGKNERDQKKSPLEEKYFIPTVYQFEFLLTLRLKR